MRTILLALLLLIIFIGKTNAQNDNLIPLPNQSTTFPVGKKVTYYSLKDIYGNTLNTETLKGKVVVLNFWFITCAPCRKEMPGLNELAYEYARQPNVVFIAIAIDSKLHLKEFLKTHPLAYQIIANGRQYDDKYGVNTFPTNVLVDKKGIVRFSDEGFSNTTQYWLRKNIDKALKE